MHPSDEKAGQLSGPGARSILLNGAFLLGSGWLAMAMRAVYIVVLARALGPSGYGLISATQALYLMFIVAGTAGVTAYLSRELALDHERGQQTVSLTLFMLTALLLLGAFVFIAIGLITESDPVTRQIFVLFTGALVARGLAMWARSAFVALEASQYHLRQVSLFRTGEVLVAIAALSMGAGVIAIATIHLVSWILEALVGVTTIHRRFTSLTFKPRDWSRLGKVAKGSLVVGIAIAAADWLRVAPLVLYHYLADAAPEVGQFAFAWNAALVLAVILVTAMNAAFPVTSRANVRADGKDAYYLDFCIRGGIILGTAAVIAGMAIGPWALTLVGGAQYDGAGKIFIATLTILGPIVMNYALDQALFLQQRTGLVLALNVGALPIVAGAFIVAIEASGPEAAVLAVFAAQAALVLLKIAIMNSVAGTQLFPALGRAIIAAAAGLAITIPLLALSAWGGLAGIAALIGAAFISKAIAAEELNILKKVVTR
ncbi:MAG: oligosaccharide flippase family protein [Rhizobiales bacterium]|nr:oligosaccharide flippase family protein [Hyphomicrobiales bacterium]